VQRTQAVEPTLAGKARLAVKARQAVKPFLPMKATQWKAVARMREVSRTVAASTCSPTLTHSALNEQGIEMHSKKLFAHILYRLQIPFNSYLEKAEILNQKKMQYQVAREA
jgi:hypothetical protein